MTADLAPPQPTPHVTQPVAQPVAQPAARPAPEKGHAHTRSCYWDLRECRWVCP